MTEQRACATDTGLTIERRVSDCQSDAVVLAGMVEAIDLMANEGERFGNAIAAVTIAALDRANKLASDLDSINFKGA
ncbi:hypothetical protein [Tropicimonas sediminicola]|uniref:Methyl-accepting chemotaxis protein n=1 Tax=Tropicimonas sediminicola TaxID=1031541 RepID=A0A239M570_9RHOB|nr:hypothetical protein [Tropicimonas sediminicola]SNT38017.1 hypothetical protein SAMN05421757_11361 [Tropicimonas sediminicola]